MRFNQSSKKKNVTVNHEGEMAYAVSPELELYSAVCTSILSGKFYESQDDCLGRIRNLIVRVKPSFANKLAIYARTQMHLRTIPLVLCVELARERILDRKTVSECIQRPDEITELLAYYRKANGHDKLNRIAKPIQLGIKDVFESGRFDEYQFAKYNSNTEIRLRDAMFLTHPKPTDEGLFNRIANDTLKTPYTWEVELSSRGNSKEVWDELVRSGRLGYMAMLRNLRNMLNSGADMEKVCAIISDPEQVRRSRQLPFRFLSAYYEISRTESSFKCPLVMKAIENAAVASAMNFPGFDDENVLIACDVSASMQHPISRRSSVQLYDIGLLLGMMLKFRCANVISGMFGDSWKVIQLPRNNILANTVEYHRREGEVGYSTNGYKAIQWCLENNVYCDRIMMFTDCQLWVSGYDRYPVRLNKLWSEYKNRYPRCRLYLFDLAGYGTTPLSIDNDVYMISGWSDKIFDVLDLIEKGGDIVGKLGG
jgi:hypothetical protein